MSEAEPRKKKEEPPKRDGAVWTDRKNGFFAPVTASDQTCDGTNFYEKLGSKTGGERALPSRYGDYVVGFFSVSFFLRHPSHRVALQKVCICPSTSQAEQGKQAKMRYDVQVSGIHFTSLSFFLFFFALWSFESTTGCYYE